MNKKRAVLLILLVVLLVAGISGCTNTAQESASDEQEYQTSVAQLGDLTVSAYGVGTLVGSETEAVAFQSEGELLELNVQEGAQVAAGDVLAVVDSERAELLLAEASAQLDEAEMAMCVAQAEYDALAKLDYDPNLVAAQAELEAAYDAFDDVSAGPTEADIATANMHVLDAQEAYDRVVNGPDASDIESAQLSLDRAKNSLWSTQNSRDTTLGNPNASQADINKAEANVLNAEISVREAEMKLEELVEPATQAEEMAALATLLTAQESLEELLAQPDAAAIAQAEDRALEAEIALAGSSEGQSLLEADVALRKAQVVFADASEAYDLALEALQATTLVSPIDGLVTRVDVELGEEVEIGDSITVVDTVHPYVQVYLDESDFGNARVGYEAEVVFDAMPDVVYTGEVAQVGAELVSIGNTDAVEVLVDLDTGGTALTLGMNASVDIIGGRATNAVLVPYEAVREIQDDQYVVFVVEDSELIMRQVQVGLSDMMTAEIISGVEADEVVSTGNVVTNLGEE